MLVSSPDRPLKKTQAFEEEEEKHRQQEYTCRYTTNDTDLSSVQGKWPVDKVVLTDTCLVALVCTLDSNKHSNNNFHLK